MSTDIEKKQINAYDKFLKGAAALVKKYEKIGLAATKEFVKDSISAAKNKMAAEMNMETVMKSLNGATAEQIEGIKKYANELQKLGVTGDEVQLSGVKQLATNKLGTETIKALLPGMNDLIALQHGVAATQQDAANTGNMLAAVMTGQTDVLAKAGMKFSFAQGEILKYGKESDKASTLAKILNDNIGGLSQTMADTDIGRIQNMKNAWADVKEEVGMVVLGLQGGLAKWFVQYIPYIHSITVNVFQRIKEAIVRNAPMINTLTEKIKSFGRIMKEVGIWGLDAFEKIKEKINENMPAFEGVRGILDELRSGAENIGLTFDNAFKLFKPILDWMKNVGLPSIVDSIGEICNGAIKLYNFIKDKWVIFEPIIWGVAGALAFYNAAMLVANINTIIYNSYVAITIVLKYMLATATAFLSSGLGIATMVIGGLIIAGVALYRNWDTVKEKALVLWESIQSIYGNVSTFFKNVFNNALEGVLSFFRPAAELINMVIDGVNQINFTVPDWVPKYGGMSFGIDIPKIPAFAMGTTYSRGGLALLHERGGEIRHLSSGEAIIPADKSQRLIEGASNAPNITININGSNMSTDEVVNEMVTRLKFTLANM